MKIINMQVHNHKRSLIDDSRRSQQGFENSIAITLAEKSNRQFIFNEN